MQWNFWTRRRSLLWLEVILLLSSSWNLTGCMRMLSEVAWKRKKIELLIFNYSVRFLFFVFFILRLLDAFSRWVVSFAKLSKYFCCQLTIGAGEYVRLFLPCYSTVLWTSALVRSCTVLTKTVKSSKKGQIISMNDTFSCS